MKAFKHIISLGYFCSPAQEIERIGLRECSSPFDWLISSDLEMLMVLIDKKFNDFLKTELLYQNRENPSYYYNIKYNVWFCHDFNGYESLVEQLPNVKEKYRRRIERFYKNIMEPTLFIRYILDNNELTFIENNIDKILMMLQKFNVKNEILFIANKDLKSNKILFFSVEPDRDDTVSRKFLEKNEELYKYLDEGIIYDKYLREKNYRTYKNKRKVTKICKIYKKLKNKTKILFLGEYEHCRKI